MACDLASVLLALKLVTPYLEETHDFDRSVSSGGIGWTSSTVSATNTWTSPGSSGINYDLSTKKDQVDRLKAEIKENQERLAQLEKERAAEVQRNANIKRAKDIAKECK